MNRIVVPFVILVGFFLVLFLIAALIIGLIKGLFALIGYGFVALVAVVAFFGIRRWVRSRYS